MAKKNFTKRALLSSVLAMFLCFAMLVGTTFAWFTDSVTSEGNIIQTGTLKVAMSWANGTEDPASANWTDASAGPIFNYDLWEPGYADVKHVQIENKGTLGLKYIIKIVANGEVTDLADVIDVYYMDPAAQVTDRAALTADKKLGTLTEVLAGVETSAAGELAVGEKHTITLALKMQEEAGNEYQDKSIGTTFSVVLLATQLSAENDAFGPDYDKDAAYAVDYFVTSSAELQAAINEGGTIALMEDIDLSALMSRAAADPSLKVPAGKEVVIDLNGHTLSSTSAQTGKNYDMIDVRGTLTVKNGTVVTKHEGANMGWGYSTNVFNVTAGGVLNIEDAEIKNIGGSDMAIGIHLNNWGEVTLNVNNSTITATYTAVRVFNSGYDMNNVTITNSKLVGNSQSFWVHNYTAEDFGTQDKADAQAKLLNLNILVKNPVAGATDASNLNAAANNTFIGKIRYGFTNGSIFYNSDTVAVSNADKLVAGLESGKVVLTSDITLDKTIVVDNDAVIDLNGYTLAGTSTSSTTSALINVKAGAELTLTGEGTVTFEAANPDADWNPEGFPTYANNTISCSGKLVVDGVTIKNTTNPGGASYAIDCYPGAELVVNSGLIDGCGKLAIRMFCNSNTVATNVTINGGTITGKRAIWVQLPSSNINNERLANLTINGGEFICTNTEKDVCIYSYSYGDSFAKTNITITGGTFTGDVCFGGGRAKSTQENVTVTGGTFNGYLGRYLENDAWEDIVKP